MAVSGVAGINLGQLAQLYRAQVTGADTGVPATRGPDFGAVLKNGLLNLETLDQTAKAKAVQAATGDLTDVHDYVIAATQAQTATELTTTIRNKALESFNEIMRMPL